MSLLLDSGIVYAVPTIAVTTGTLAPGDSFKVSSAG